MLNQQLLPMFGDRIAANTELDFVDPVPENSEQGIAELAAKAAETALAGAQALAKNAYKIPLTKEIVQRTVTAVAANRA